jgi:predicted porin
MKKSLFALAAIGAFAGGVQAQSSSVTLYGVMDVSAVQGSDKLTASGTTTTVNQRSTGAGKDGLASSRIGIRGTEDLGGGLSASFVWEQGIVSVATGGTGSGQASTNAADATTTTSPAGAFTDPRQAYVGLASKSWGELRLGRQATSTHNVIAAYSAGGANNNAGALYSAGGSVANNSNVRMYEVYVNRAINYSTPVMNGFQLTVQTAQQSAVTETTSSPVTATSSSGANASYRVGNFSAGAGYEQKDLNGQTTDVKQTMTSIGASYNFGVATLMGEYLHFSAKTPTVSLGKTQVYEIGVRVPASKTIDLWASMLGGSKTGGDGYTSSTTLVRSLTAIQGQGDISGFQLGAKYNLSKRSSLYAIGGTQQIKGSGLTSASKTETTQVALGINHTF